MSPFGAGSAQRASADATTLLDAARDLLGQAGCEQSAAERFRLAHIAALRTTAAVFAERGRPANTRRRLISAWVLLRAVAPELAEWSTYFAAGAAARAAVEAGASSAVTPRDADDQLRAATEFLHLVEEQLGFLSLAS
jgi:HEPN superfamily protein